MGERGSRAGSDSVGGHVGRAGWKVGGERGRKGGSSREERWEPPSWEARGGMGMTAGENLHGG
eukprot:694672-Rhodomonas_salina.1